MRSAGLSLLLVTACWALPFRQSGFMDFMMEDEPGSGHEAFPGPTVPDVAGPVAGPAAGPMCPFRCQCHLRVTQCSDLGRRRVVCCVLFVLFISTDR